MATQNIGNIGGGGGGGSSSSTTTAATTTTALLPSSSTSTSSSLLSPSSTAPNVQSSSQIFNTQQQQQQKSGNNFEPLDKSSSNTLKRNPKMELSKTDLLKLLGYLEGELQARDIVIAALKSEKMKHLLNSRYRSGTTDPQAALTRDVAIVGGVIRMECSQADRQVASLEAQCRMAKVTQCRMAKVLKEAEMRHRTVIKELEEEKRKHEHDTAQGDDITYGLEKERTRLKKELELERQEKKRLEIELKKETVTLEMEKSRQKQIVLLLLAERKKIIMKYIEERKRSEDLAQILSEEKVRIDSMAEGLEEESKKSLQMEAELEKQLAQFDIERQQYRQAILKEEKKTKEFEAEVERMKIELESWKARSGSGVIRGPIGVTPPPPPAKPANLTGITTLRPAGTSQALKGPGVLGTGTPMVSSKVVQPTATVSSVPVSGPTTGIARSVTPRQAMRGVTYGSAVAPAVTTVSNVANDTATTTTTTATSLTSTTAAAVAPNTTGATTVASSVVDTTNTTVTEPQTTDKRNVAKDGKLSSPSPSLSSSSTTTTTTTTATTTITTTATTTVTSAFGQTAVAITAAIAAKKPLIPRGIPPPVPPNKPIVPPKKEGAPYMRRPDQNQQIQDVKLIKPACQTTVVNQNQQQVQAISSVPSHQITEEAKPR